MARMPSDASQMLPDVTRGSQMVLDGSTLGREWQTYEETGIGGQTWQTGPMSNWTANGHELGQTAAPQDARGATPISLYNYFVYSRSTAPGGCMLIKGVL